MAHFVLQHPPQTAVAADEQQQTAVAASLTMSDYTVMAMAEQQSATICNDDDSDGHSDRKNCGSDSDDEKEEGDVQLNSMMAIVSCPQYDWRCSTCHKCVNEVDKSRRWVDPRPCQKCKKPMETWRTRESICPIFKPEGSAPSARELKVHRDRS